MQNLLKKYFFTFIAICVLLVFNTKLNAQIDTTLQLSTIEISASRIEKFEEGLSNQKIGKEDLEEFKTANIADLLSQRSAIYVKSYGLGSLATISTRGTSANHTPVLWNGFNLQNSMNGTVDFALIPSFLSDEINVQSGAASALYGSGAIGGIISLENKNSLNKGLKIRLGNSIGSFSDFQQNAHISFGKSRFGSSLKIFNHTAKNDFKLDKNGTQKQTNAALSARGLLQNNTFQLSPKQQLKTYIWWQENERQIPPSRTESSSNAKQDDKWLRLGTEYTWTGQKHLFKARTAWLTENLLFNSASVDSAYSEAKTLIIEAEDEFMIGQNWRLNVGTNYTNQDAKAEEIGDQKIRNRLAFFTSIKKTFWKERLVSVLNLRQEWVETKSIPFTFSWNNNLTFGKYWLFHTKVAKSYNLPTFNDLYWAGIGAVGNQDLLPESAWNYEGGIQFSDKKGSLRPKIKLSVFSNHTENLIQWLPSEIGWTPTNNKSVWGRGWEASLELNAIENSVSKGEKKTLFQLGINAAFTRATIAEVYAEGQERFLDKQLINTPLWTGNAHLKVNIKKTSLLFQQSLTGERFLTTNNAEDEILPSFSVGNVSVSHAFTIKNIKAVLGLKVFNIFDVEYEIIEARGMPFRYFKVEVGVGF